MILPVLYFSYGIKLGKLLRITLLRFIHSKVIVNLYDNC